MKITGKAQYDAWQQRVLPPVEEVRPGLWSIPVPIPHNPLRYTLSYVFADASTVVVVDPGWDSDDGRDAVKSGLAVAGVDVTDVTGVVVTHIHPDHHGLSAWLRDEAGAWVGMHPLEASTLPARLWGESGPRADQGWLVRAGVPATEVDVLSVDEERMAPLLLMAEPDRLLDDGALLPLPGRTVRAVWTPGHTPGHLCLHDAEAGVLLTGDHLLPRISPNIAAFGVDDDPLGDYLVSLEKTTAFQADEALPAHEHRFRDIGVRAEALIAHHDDRGAEVLRAAAQLPDPTAWAIAATLTWSRGWDALSGLLRRMALAETIAHLHHLVATGALTSTGGIPTRWHPAEA